MNDDVWCMMILTQWLWCPDLDNNKIKTEREQCYEYIIDMNEDDDKQAITPTTRLQ